jgi:hypothetical protein
LSAFFNGEPTKKIIEQAASVIDPATEFKNGFYFHDYSTKIGKIEVLLEIPTRSASILNFRGQQSAPLFTVQST